VADVAPTALKHNAAKRLAAKKLTPPIPNITTHNAGAGTGCGYRGLPRASAAAYPPPTGGDAVVRIASPVTAADPPWAFPPLAFTYPGGMLLGSAQIGDGDSGHLPPRTVVRGVRQRSVREA